jgi:hypothetical protein
MATYNGYIKRYNGSIWETYYPKTTIGQVTDLATSLADLQSDIDLKAPLASPTFTGIVTAPKVTLTNSSIEPESVTFDGATSIGLRASNANGYVSITPLNTGWAHIYTDRSNFIFNRPVYSVSNIFSSYDADLLLRRAGTTKLTLGSSGATFADDVTANGQLLVKDNDSRLSQTILEVLTSDPASPAAGRMWINTNA